LAAIVVYVNSIPGNFAFDDKLIQRDARIQGQTSFWTIFVSDYWYHYIGTTPDLYRPLTIASYALNYAVSGLYSPAFHVVNVLLHALFCGLLVALVDALLRDRSLAIVAGLLFAVHPIHTESVTSIVGRAEVMSALFLVVALYLHTRRYALWGTGKGIWLPAALLSYFCSLLSKETAIVGPGLIVVIEYINQVRSAPSAEKTGSIRSGFDAATLRRLAQELALYVGVAALYLYIRFRVLGRFLQEPPAKQYYLLFGQPLLTRLLTGLDILAIYMRLLFYPVTLSADYSYRQVPLVTSLNSIGSVIGLLLAVALCGAFVWALRRRVLPAVFALAFFAVAYSIVSNFIVPIGVLVAERLMYLPSVGFCVGLAWVGLVLGRRFAGALSPGWMRYVPVAILSVVLLLYSARTFMRNFDWWDQETIYAATVKASPECHAARFNYSAVLMQTSKRPDRAQLALENLLKAYEIRPDHYPGLINLSLQYLQLGQLDKAREIALQGLKVSPDSKKLRGILEQIDGRVRQPKAAGR
jgi:protein O-mannosyl-transferase